ncbi:MAG: alkaline phosphatase, partial [Sphingomonas sp.]
MYEVDRRYLLSALGSLTAAGLLPWRATAAEIRPRNLIADPRFPNPPFTLGVASGDPDADGFVIWTRLAPLPLEPDGGMMMAPVLVAWEVAADPAFRQILQRGEAIAHPELAHSVHVELTGLAPARPYWYRFSCGGASPVSST